VSVSAWMRRPTIAAWVLLPGAVAAMGAHAAPLADNVRLISATTPAALPAPPSHSFSVTQAGMYTIVLTDLATPNALSSLSVAVASSTASAAQLQVTSPAESDSKTVQLDAGTYTVQPLAVTAPGSGGAFTVTVTPQGGGAAILTQPWAVAATPGSSPPGQSAFRRTFTPTDAGLYMLTMTDRIFPAALSAFQAIVLHEPDGATVCTIASLAVPNCTMTLVAGDSYDLIVLANADATTLAGLISLDVIGGSVGTSEPYGESVAVGSLSQPVVAQVAAGGNVVVQLSDLNYPSALASVQAVATQGAQFLQQFNVAGSANINAAAGAMQVFVWAAPNATSGEGAYAVYVHDASNTLADVAVPVFDSNHVGYAFSTTLAAAGNDQLVVTDYQLPSALVALDALAEQHGQRLGAGISPAPTLNAAAGKMTMLAFAGAPVAGANGLFGIDLLEGSSSNALFQITQGVGASFQTVDIIATAGKYVAQLTDLGFPADFSQVWMIGTGNRQVLTQIVIGQGSSTGRVVFDVPTTGSYVINVLAQVGAGQHYGLYGFNLVAAPPAPVVTLAASASSIVSGGHVTLTWSSTDATSCTASDGWSGTLDPSGSQDSANLTGNTTFTLTCTGDGGDSTPAQVQVQVTQPPSSGGGGGGTLDLATVCALALGMAAALRRRLLQSSQLPGFRARGAGSAHPSSASAIAPPRLHRAADARGR
jgi:hypothetical protein